MFHTISFSSQILSIDFLLQKITFSSSVFKKKKSLIQFLIKGVFSIILLQCMKVKIGITVYCDFFFPFLKAIFRVNNCFSFFLFFFMYTSILRLQNIQQNWKAALQLQTSEIICQLHFIFLGASLLEFATLLLQSKLCCFMKTYCIALGPMLLKKKKKLIL